MWFCNCSGSFLRVRHHVCLFGHHAQKTVTISSLFSNPRRELLSSQPSRPVMVCSANADFCIPIKRPTGLKHAGLGFIV